MIAERVTDEAYGHDSPEELETRQRSNDIVRRNERIRYRERLKMAVRAVESRCERRYEKSLKRARFLSVALAVLVGLLMAVFVFVPCITR